MSEFRFPPELRPLSPHFVQIANLLAQPLAARDRLLKTVRTSPSMGSYEEIDAIAADVEGTDLNALYAALNLVGSIVRELPAEAETGQEVYDALLDAAPVDASERMREHRPFIVDFLDAMMMRRGDLDVRALANGPNAVLVSSTASVMLAAAVRGDSISGYLPVTLVRLETSNQESILLQFDEWRLAAFIEDMQGVSRQLAALRSDGADAAPVHPPLNHPPG